MSSTSKFLRLVNIRLIILAGLAIVAVSLDFAYGAKAEDDAINCAKEWLSLVDGGLFAESWKAAGPYMQRDFPSEAWERKLDSVRKPLGEVVSRRLKRANFGKPMQQVPDGDYFKLQFDTSFSSGKQVVETVTSVLQKDGRWKVSGYYIE